MKIILKLNLKNFNKQKLNIITNIINVYILLCFSRVINLVGDKLFKPNNIFIHKKGFLYVQILPLY